MTDDDLIDGYFHDQLSLTEVEQLEARLKEDPAVRERYRRYAEMTYGLVAMARISEPAEGDVTSSQSRWLVVAWPQIAAACVLASILASSAAAWYVERRMPPPAEHFVVLEDDFEGNEVEIFKRDFVPGVWHGDGIHVSWVDGLPRAFDGSNYVRLPPHERRTLSYLDGIVDLREGQRMREERGATRVRLYCRVAMRPEALKAIPEARYRLRLATFVSAPEQTGREWRLGPPQFVGETYSHRALRTAVGVDQWHLLETTVDVPPGVQSAMVSVSAKSEGGRAASHCVDSVRAELVFEYD